MRKCELWDMGQFGGTGELLGFAGTMDEVRAIVQMESGFLCACALGGVKMLPAATESPDLGVRDPSRALYTPENWEVRDAALEEAAQCVSEEVCSCCWSEEAQAFAEHAAGAIRSIRSQPAPVAAPAEVVTDEEMWQIAVSEAGTCIPQWGSGTYLDVQTPEALGEVVRAILAKSKGGA